MLVDDWLNQKPKQQKVQIFPNTSKPRDLAQNEAEALLIISKVQKRSGTAKNSLFSPENRPHAGQDILPRFRVFERRSARLACVPGFNTCSEHVTFTCNVVLIMIFVIICCRTTYTIDDFLCHVL